MSDRRESCYREIFETAEGRETLVCCQCVFALGLPRATYTRTQIMLHVARLRCVPLEQVDAWHVEHSLIYLWMVGYVRSFVLEDIGVEMWTRIEN